MKKKRLTHIVLTNMNTLSINSNSHIDTVIDDQRNIVLLCDFVKFTSAINENAGVNIFLSKLDYSDRTFGNGLFNLIKKSAPLGIRLESVTK